MSKFELSSTLKACATNGYLSQGRTTHHHAIKSGQDANAVVGTAIVNMYAKCGSFDEARRTFDLCRVRDLVSWNAMISACIDHENGLLALDFLHKMQQIGGLYPNNISITLAFKACGLGSIIWDGRIIHEYIIKSRKDLDEVCGSSLIDMYAKCGHMDDAHSVFRTLPLENVVLWGALMAGYVQEGLGFAALELFEEMQQCGVLASPAIFSCVLKACGSGRAVKKGKLIHDQIMSCGLGSDVIVNNALMDMYAKCGQFEEACRVLYKVPGCDERSWGAIIGGFVQQSCYDSALELFRSMVQKGIRPNQIIYSCVLKACGDSGAKDEGKLIHEQIVKSSVESDVVVCNGLIDMYANLGSLVDARKLFDTFPKVNTASCDAMLAGYAKHGHDVLAFELFDKVEQDGIKPSEIMYSCIVKACGGLKDAVRGRSIHGQIVINIFSLDVVVVNGLIDMYLNCGSFKEAKCVFDRLSNRDVISWNSILGGYLECGDSFSALELFHNMLQTNIRPDRVTLLCMVKACSGAGVLRHGRFMYEQIVRGGFESDIVVRILLVDMFARSGSLQEAQKLLHGAAQKDLGAWAAMIAGYALQGEWGLARDCFHDMQSRGLQPDVGTFTVVLAACCHGGQVEAGYWFFNTMKETYGLTPRIEHFNCLIDLLGRVGRLNEASQLLKIMPDFPDLLGWMSLLSACKKYGDAELGKTCTEEIQRLDPDNTAVHAFTSSTYGALDMVGSVFGLEKVRLGAHAWKAPGKAGIQVDDKVCGFMVGERGDSQDDDITSPKLRDLKQQVVVEAYVPKLNFLLSQEKHVVESSECAPRLVEDAETDGFIEGLSERISADTHKLQATFGLLDSFDRVTLRFVRVFANHRFAPDSISKVFKKQIILKDFYRTLSFKSYCFYSLDKKAEMSHANKGGTFC